MTDHFLCKGMRSVLQEVVNVLREKSSFSLLTHVQPDADALGSLLALGMALERMGKSVTYCTEGSERLSFLPGYEKLRLPARPDRAEAEVLIYLDCANLNRNEEMGMAGRGDLKPLMINIDHHVSNDGFGDVVWVDPEASSVGEMLWMLFEAEGIVMDAAMAANLYASIVNDTGQFAFHNTTRRTHEIAGALLGYGFRVNEIHKKLFYERSLAQTKLLAQALESLYLCHEGAVAVMFLEHDCFSAFGLSADDCEGFISQAMSVQGVQMGMFVKETEPQLCRVSFRSRGRVDVNKLAARFNGGGHVRASGCKLGMPLKQALPELLRAVDEAVAETEAAAAAAAEEAVR